MFRSEALSLQSVSTARRLVWYLAVRTMDVTHKQLAERYGVSSGLLKARNGLSSDRIRVGQVLLIPGA